MRYWFLTGGGFLYSLYWLVFSFVFFKQKTAYEMRISDWSSDVCSSDLTGLRRRDCVSDQDPPGEIGGSAHAFGSVRYARCKTQVPARGNRAGSARRVSRNQSAAS